MVGWRNVLSARAMFLARVCPEPQPVDPCDGLRTFSAHVAHIGTAAAGLRHSRAPERRRFLHMIAERRAGLRRHLLEWMGRKGGIPMGEDCVAAEPRQICSRLLPGRHFVFAFMEWSVRRGKPYKLARLVGVRPVFAALRKFESARFGAVRCEKRASNGYPPGKAPFRITKK